MTHEKIIPLDELAEIVSALKKESKRIMHCHGVFDLLHIGHIRHLKSAKRYGDALVVTITPDRFVNKGPHRPVFNEQLRAEAIASLECVDFVSINKWPNAVKTIKILKPNYYVKGIEYSEAKNDISRGIIEEENAVSEVGGELKFTDDITFSSSNLINQYLDVLPKTVKDYLKDFSSRFSFEEIISFIERIKDLKILVIGEAIIDEYQYGNPIGKSAKEPIIALKYVKSEKFAGGSLAIANHLANFSDNVDLFTVLGENDSYEDFILINLNPKITKFFHYKKDAPTIVKRRFLESNLMRKLLEFYIINDADTPKMQIEEMKQQLKQMLPRYDLVIVADFGHGMINQTLVNTIIKYSKFLAVNTQTNAGNMGYNFISKYPKADYVCTDEREIRLECRNRANELIDLLPTLAKRISCDNIITTYGSQGCIVYSSGQIREIPAFTQTVVDAMGAGDAFLSLTSPLVFLGAPMEVVGFVGNVVGAMYVKIVGNKESIEKVSLIKSINSLLK